MHAFYSAGYKVGQLKRLSSNHQRPFSLLFDIFCERREPVEIYKHGLDDPVETQSISRRNESATLSRKELKS
ncbi:hypothetical protein AWV80_29845 [Cupriavidus sp. UYMU48A]|nr:hypothetical protein AWV80_29845 [Cupriavidus sp. UYMU48A]